MEQVQTASMLRLWQLISPALPVGAYAYSQGLEAAVENDWVNDEASTFTWLSGVMQYSLATLDIPVANRLYQAIKSKDKGATEYWNSYLLASRETYELRLEDNQLGQALAKLLVSLGLKEAEAWQRGDDVTYLTMFCYAAVAWSISKNEMITGYLWAWTENQVAAAIKLIPLGQSSGQKVLSRMMDIIPNVLTKGLNCSDEQICSSVPGLAIASAEHETQYSRLFRS